MPGPRAALETGEIIVKIVRNGLTARDIITAESISNAIMVLLATGGSTNCVIHTCVIAHEIGIPAKTIMGWFEEYSVSVPLICRINLASKDYDAEDFYPAGGIPEVQRQLKDILYQDCMTLGLKWSDIDLEHGSLRVQRQIVRIDGEIVEAPLKTKNAYRTLPLSTDAVDVLKEQKKKCGNSPYVFPSPTGGPISPDSVLHMLHRVLKRAGLPKVRFHDLRHTFATLALQNGVDIKTVSGMLGHFSAGFTLDTYAHVTTSAQKEAANTMGGVLRVAANG